MNIGVDVLPSGKVIVGKAVVVPDQPAGQGRREVAP